MKPASPALAAYLDARRGAGQLVYADCYDFELKSGIVLHYTTAQATFTATPPDGPDPIQYLGGQVLVSGLKYRLAIGTDVDEQECKIISKPSVTVAGLPFIVAARVGLFDGSIVKRTRFFFERWGQPAVDGIVLFRGFFSTANDIGSIDFTGKVKSGMVLMNAQLPKEKYQPQCLNTLFDARCKLLNSDFATHGTAETGSTQQIILWSSSVADYFSQGTIRFETGPNIDVVRTVRQSTSGAIILTYPLDNVPLDTDDFVIYPGCDKSKATCNSKFSNIANFRGFPFVPPPETAT